MKLRLPAMYTIEVRRRGVTRSGNVRVCEAGPPDPLPPPVHVFMKNIPPPVRNMVRYVSNYWPPPVQGYQCSRLWAPFVYLIIILKTHPVQRFPFLYTPPVHRMLKKISLSASHTRWSRHMSDPPIPPPRESDSSCIFHRKRLFTLHRQSALKIWQKGIFMWRSNNININQM